MVMAVVTKLFLGNQERECISANHTNIANASYCLDKTTIKVHQQSPGEYDVVPNYYEDFYTIYHFIVLLLFSYQYYKIEFTFKRVRLAFLWLKIHLCLYNFYSHYPYDLLIVSI